jgi:2-oxoglutarate ferredoxin oxidoreductase subunit alpha
MDLEYPSSELKIKISGEAGDGILTAGDILMGAAARLGYYSSAFKSFPSTIRGGYSQTLVTISEEKIISPISQFDILFLTSPTAFEYDKPPLLNDVWLFIESSILEDTLNNPIIDQWKQAGHKVIKLHINETARSISANTSIKSAVTVAYLCTLLSIPVELIRDLIIGRFQKKGKETVDKNLAALEEGLRQAHKDIQPLCFSLPQKKADNKKRIIVDGNEAISLGALISGAKFYASYPITPATSIGDTLANYLLQTDGFAYQAEDEIAAIGAVIGASFNGFKALTATSGPGFSLIQEFLGYASMVELPVVVIDVQRAGPSTGMSTKHSQEDLYAAVFGGHGEGQRIVVAPNGVQDCVFTTVEAFNLSERYQCPVILLSDASMGMIKQTIDSPKPESIPIVERPVLKHHPENSTYIRYKTGPNQTNPVPVPGISPVTYRVTGLEHDEHSFPSANPVVRSRQMRRRSEKLLGIEQDNPHLMEWDLESQELYEADFSLIAWGFTASIAKKAIDIMRQQGFRIAALYPKLLFPVLTDSIEKLLQYSQLLYIPEANFSGQYSHIIRMYTDAKPHPVTLSRGDPFTPEEIVAYITRRLNIELSVSFS